MNRELRIFVPRLIDAANTNAQNLNAKALLSRFRQRGATWVTTHYGAPDAAVAAAPQVEVETLCRTQLWHWHMLLKYQQAADAIFYPGMEWFDAKGLDVRKVTGRRVPVIGTLEGLVGDEKREREFEQWVGHKVYCHHVSQDIVERCDRILRSCDHIVAITPMLAALGRKLYGDKVSTLPLGIDRTTFQSTDATRRAQFRVIGVGNLKDNKRPSILIELAGRYPSAEFVWFGQGPLLEQMRSIVGRRGLPNVNFPGTALPHELAREYSQSDLFILPSFSEGSPKVLQEAAASGLPRIAFGFYEPSIADGVDGFVVWNDEEFFARIGELIGDRDRTRNMGVKAAASVAEQDWSTIAPRWENEILSRVQELRS